MIFSIVLSWALSVLSFSIPKDKEAAYCLSDLGLGCWKVQYSSLLQL